MQNNTDQLSKTSQLRKSNSHYRTREHLTVQEINKLYATAKQQRYGHRDHTLIMLMFRHGLRISEAASLKWEQVDLDTGILHVRRMKHGINSTHPLRGIEIRALRRLKREFSDLQYVFVSERKAALTARSVGAIIERIGKLSGLGISVHAHMLRHSCGFYLANKGHDTRAIQDYLGHADIRNTVIYTQLSSTRFKNFFDD